MSKSMRIRNYKRIVLYFCFFFVPIFLCIGAFCVYNRFIKKAEMPSTVKKLIDDKKKINFSDKDINKVEVEKYDNPFPDLRVQYNNNEIYGRLEIPNLNINTLITRAINNNYYLDYSINKEYDKLGVPFFDYRNLDLVNDRQINIYGHNTRNTDFYDKLPFVKLDAYSDENIFNNYKDVYLAIDEEIKQYRVVAVKIITSDSNNEHMKIRFRDDLDYISHVNRMISNSLYKEEGLELYSTDKLLVLQVCHYNPPDSYLIVICREV